MNNPAERPPRLVVVEVSANGEIRLSLEDMIVLGVGPGDEVPLLYIQRGHNVPSEPP